MLPETVAEIAAGHRVAAAMLFRFEFASSTQRFWDGIGWLEAAAQSWLGFGEFGSVSGIGQTSAMAASPVTFTLSGVDDQLLAIAANSANEVTGRPWAVFVQFLTAAHQPLDSPVALGAGKMDVMSFEAAVPNQRIKLSAEGLFVSRVRAPHGYMTDTDQQARFPGDKGLEFMPLLKNKTVTWLRS